KIDVNARAIDEHAVQIEAAIQVNCERSARKIRGRITNRELGRGWSGGCGGCACVRSAPIQGRFARIYGRAETRVGAIEILKAGRAVGGAGWRRNQREHSEEKQTGGGQA